MSERVFNHDGYNLVIKFPYVFLFPIIAGAAIAFIVYSMTIWHVGFNDGKKANLNVMAHDCDSTDGSFVYHDNDGNTYYFKCSFDFKSERKPWNK